MNHNHCHSCDHSNIKFCKLCNVAYCVDCKQEFRANYWYYNYYNRPFYTTPGWIYTNTSSAAPVTSGYFDVNLRPTSEVSLNFNETTSCAHN